MRQTVTKAKRDAAYYEAALVLEAQATMGGNRAHASWGAGSGAHQGKALG